ncbi:MAG TPA: hypothetical protein VGU27_07715 [Candidatus Eisenbacteria bacterium]|nr:hypothetical protein [Candidatus Eisenbacteria bacterium]
MKTRYLAGLLAGALLACAGGPASADVKVKVAVTPDTVFQCSRAQVFFAIGNTGTQPIGAHVCIALARNDTVIVGPLCGNVRLAAGERRQHEFDLFVPPRTPVGQYALIARATGTDGSSDQSIAPFRVEPSPLGAPCFAPPSTLSPEADMTSSVLSGSGVTPDQSTGVQPSTWGRLKLLYR